MFTNAVAVYLLHDVDADRIGKWSLAYWELTREFFVFGLVLTASFFLLTWIGTLLFGLRHVAPNLRLGLILGVAVTLLQYPAEYIVRELTAEHSADTFLLGYIVLSPISCAAVVLVDAYKRRLVK
jgi:hypothetical protein